MSQLNLAMVWSHPTGAAYRNEQLIRYGLEGSSDILGVTNHDGIILCIEVKTGRGVQSEVQANFERAIKKRGGRYFVARSTQSAIEFVQATVPR